MVPSPMTNFAAKKGQPVPGEKDAKGAYSTPEPFQLNQFLFDKQIEFVTDKRPFKVAVCSRRAGKTIACAADLIYTSLLTPEIVCLYITLARTNAEKIVWPELKKINERFKMKAKFDEVKLSMTFPNGSVIYCSGAKDSSEIEKFRGLALKKVYVDECQSFRSHLKELIDDVLVPALMDYDGSLILIGTPGPVPAGYFAEISGASQKSKAYVADEDPDEEEFNWARFHWTFFDNPHIARKSKKTHEQVLRRALKMRGVPITDPSIQREFFGKWVMDSSSLWIKYNASLNHFDKLEPNRHWNYILGIDLGFNDADALAVLAWGEHTDKIYLVEETVVAKQDLTDLVDAIKHVQSRYDISKMVIDEGGLGKKMAEELRRRHSIPVHAADKARKQENVAFLNDALRTGRFMAKHDSRFAQDTLLVEIDWDKSTPDRIRVSDKYHSDIIDAVLYAFRESHAYAYEPPDLAATPGTPEWYKEEEERMWEAEQRQLEEKAELESMYFGAES